jgi:hypothetical protein
MRHRRHYKKQKGAVILLTALVLLICITLVIFLCSKTVGVQVQIAADNHRMAQAVASANAGLAFGIGYFNGTATIANGLFTTGKMVKAGFDHDDDKCPDFLANPLSYFESVSHQIKNCPATLPHTLTYQSVDGKLMTTATVTFDNDAGTRCVSNGVTANMKAGLITAVGFSDDGLAQRMLSQCVGAFNIFGTNTPKYSMISRGTVSLTGNYSLINRFDSANIWSGGGVALGKSPAAGTYLRSVGSLESAYSRSQLEQSSLATATSQSISGPSKGTGVDIMSADLGLASLTGDAFFSNFFYGDRLAIKSLAQSINQVYAATDYSSANANSGVIWIEGDVTINNRTYGAIDNPTIMIINGNLTLKGVSNFTGLLYVRGQLDAVGAVAVLGALVVEGDTRLVPNGEAAVVGAGDLTLIYSPYALDRLSNPLVGTTTAISGSWRDW